MSRPDNPYDAPIEQQSPGLTLQMKVIVGVVGTFVVAGTAMTLGAFLFGLLILIAGKNQPSPLATVQWLESPVQQMIFGIGSIFIALTSLLLGSLTVSRIVRSQRLTAELLFRRREFQSTVGKLHSAVMEQKIASQPRELTVHDQSKSSHDM